MSVFLPMQALGSNTSAQSAKAKSRSAQPLLDKVTCLPTELKLKNCHLQYKGMKFHLWDKKIFYFDGRFRDTINLKDVGAGVQWHGVSIGTISSRHFLEFYVWGAPEGDLKIQSMNWTVWEVFESRFSLVVEKVIQKRKPQTDGMIAAEDTLIKPQILVEAGKLKWKVANESALIPDFKKPEVPVNPLLIQLEQKKKSELAKGPNSRMISAGKKKKDQESEEEVNLHEGPDPEDDSGAVDPVLYSERKKKLLELQAAEEVEAQKKRDKNKITNSSSEKSNKATPD